MDNAKFDENELLATVTTIIPREAKKRKGKKRRRKLMDNAERNLLLYVSRYRFDLNTGRLIIEIYRSQ